MKVGVDYYPEHWDESVWEEDAIAMKQAGISLVRLAEFSWSVLEPHENQYNFDWLDKAIGIFKNQNISVVLGTPTATPPNWLVEQCPDVLPVNNQKQPIYPGVRCHRCYNSPSLRLHTAKIIKKLTNQYGKNKAVIGWQTDNEIAANDCHCENCIQAFRSWLQRKYGSLEKLNAEWGTVVWSGTYTSWSQVNTPLGGSPHQNPSFLLDYQRFCSDSAADFNHYQAELLRTDITDQFVTHNLWGYPVMTNYYDLFKSMDFVSVDYYPSTDLNDDAKASIYHGALTLDLTRGVQRKNFWVMEQLSGTPGCWNPMSRAPFPGMIRAHAWQSVSRGADTIVNFRWRSARIGAEQFWHGLHDHHGEKGRRMDEFTQFASELNQLNDLLEGSTVVNEVAMLFSHDQHNAFKIQPQSDEFDYLLNFRTIHKAFLRLGIGTDVINCGQELSGYKLVVAPYLFLEDPALVRQLEMFAQNGGTVLLTTRTGVKNLTNVCQPARLPGQFSKLAGISLEEYDPVGRDLQSILLKNNQQISCSQWCDVINLETAAPYAFYDSEYYKGTPAITENIFGSGKAFYLGSVLALDGYIQILKEILTSAGFNEIHELPDGIELAKRSKDGKSIHFLMNLSNQPQSIVLPDTGHQCVFSGENLSGYHQLQPGEVQISITR